MKNNKLLVLVPFLLLMVSCDNNSNLNSNSTSNSNSTTQPTDSWSNEIKLLMKEVLGEELPYVALDANTVQYGKDSDENGEYFYLTDSSATSIVETYKSTLVSNGYTLSSTDNDYGYDVFIYTKDTIVVQLDYFPGAEEDNVVYNPGNEIYAWLDLPTQRTDLTDWPEELKTIMTNTFNYQIPFVALASDFEYSLNDEVLTISDASDTDFLSDGFEEALIKAGFIKSTTSTSENYTAYNLTLNDNSYLSVEFAFTETSEFLGMIIPGGNEIYITLNHVTKTWPAEVIRNIYSNLSTVTIPEFAANGNYEYYLANNGILISGDVSSDITKDYIAKLGENNFMTDEDYFGNQFYYDWEEYVNVEVQYSNSKFMVQVVPVDRSYTEFVTSFPADKIKALLGEGTTEVPSIDIKIGDNIKYTLVEKNEDYGTPAYIELTYKDDTSDISKSIMTNYVEVLKAAGWTIDDSYYDEDGVYEAVSANKDVALEFYSAYNKFVLDIQLVETNSSKSDGEWNSELKALMIELLGEEIPYVAMDGESLYYSKETDDSGDMLYISDYFETSFVDAYKEILLANGYTHYKDVTEDGYTTYIYEKGNITIEFAFVSATDNEPAGNYILAYVD